MTAARHPVTATALLATVALTACGGGGGSGGGGGPGPASPQAAFAADPGQVAETAGGAETAAPQFGSVHQSLGAGVARVRSAGITRRGDGSLTATVIRTDGSRTVLNSEDHRYGDAEDRVSPTGRAAEFTVMVREDSDSLTAAAGLADHDPGDLGDWMAGGYWLHIRGDWRNGRVDGVELGAVIDGPEISGRADVPGIGSASYRGVAGGIYATVYGTDADAPRGTAELGEYRGDFTARADFASGTVSGSVGNILIGGVGARPDGTEYEFESTRTSARLVLEEASIGGDGTMAGTLRYTSPDHDVVETGGYWGSRLSSRPDGMGNPRLLGGTHAGAARTGGGSEVAFVGAHYGASGDFR